MPPSFRDRVRARVRAGARDAARRAVQNIADAARRGLRRVFVQPEPEAEPLRPSPPQRPQRPEPPQRAELPEPGSAPSPPPRRRPPQRSELPEPPTPESTRDLSEQERAQAHELLGQLQELRGIVERLRQLGYEEAAQAVMGVPDEYKPGRVPATEGMPEPGTLPEAPEPAEPATPPEAPALPPQRPPREPAQQQDDEEIDQLPPADQGERRYPLSGSSILIPYDKDPATVFDLLVETWGRASPGSRRDPETGLPLDARPPFAPDAVAIGSDVDPGKQIPQEALINRSAFARWCQQEGYGDGLAVEIDGLVAKPGRPILPAVARARDEGKVPRRPRTTVPSHLSSGASDDEQ